VIGRFLGVNVEHETVARNTSRSLRVVLVYVKPQARNYVNLFIAAVVDCYLGRRRFDVFVARRYCSGTLFAQECLNGKRINSFLTFATRENIHF
jgi:hypothetical protein